MRNIYLWFWLASLGTSYKHRGDHPHPHHLLELFTYWWRHFLVSGVQDHCLSSQYLYRYCLFMKENIVHSQNKVRIGLVSITDIFWF
jgi:hypothetical protein